VTAGDTAPRDAGPHRAPRPDGALAVTIGQHTTAGRKPANQDFHGALVPDAPLLHSKGVAAAIADGISSSSVSAIAAETAVASFLEDYFGTPESWGVKSSARRVIAATNAWLHAQTRDRDGNPDRGYVCTFSALVLKGATAHVFHAGDTRIARLAGATLEPLTEDHRAGTDYLARALGIAREVEIDYRAIPVSAGDVFVFGSSNNSNFTFPFPLSSLASLSEQVPGYLPWEGKNQAERDRIEHISPDSQAASLARTSPMSGTQSVCIIQGLL